MSKNGKLEVCCSMFAISDIKQKPVYREDVNNKLVAAFKVFPSLLRIMIGSYRFFEGLKPGATNNFEGNSQHSWNQIINAKDGHRLGGHPKILYSSS